ncbi:MAG: hypothetical protein IGBAC_0755 [Ignavibacteriae bacterium]|nr:MAG: hypothetical protein IGBAC_0755 [Ignavibacteriota bacterium]
MIILSGIAIYFIYSGILKSNTFVSEIIFRDVPDIDSVILKIFEKYRIPQTNIQFKKIRFEESNFVRDEISVNIPGTISKDSMLKADTLFLLIHYDLKQALSGFDYRVSGVENTSERVTTLFIESKGKIIKTIIFKLQTKKERSYSYQLKNKRK